MHFTVCVAGRLGPDGGDTLFIFIHSLYFIFANPILRFSLHLTLNMLD